MLAQFPHLLFSTHNTARARASQAPPQAAEHPHPDKSDAFFKLLSQCRKKAYACAQLASLIRPVLETEWSDRARFWVHLHAGAQRCVKDTGGPAPRSLLHPELATGSSVLRRLQNWTKESSGSKASRIFRAALLATSWQIDPAKNWLDLTSGSRALATTRTQHVQAI